MDNKLFHNFELSYWKKRTAPFGCIVKEVSINLKEIKSCENKKHRRLTNSSYLLVLLGRYAVGIVTVIRRDL